MNNSRIIIGIDPGTVVLGYGIIEIEGNKIKLLSMGVVQLAKHTDPLDKLKTIADKTKHLIEAYKVQHCAIEAPFFGKNAQSMLKLGRAQGVAIAAALQGGSTVTEYSPKKIKQSITGNGNASKEQVAAMLQTIVGFEIQPKFLDATDGLAAAVCHHFQTTSAMPAAGKASGWAAFIKNNPGRVK